MGTHEINEKLSAIEDAKRVYLSAPWMKHWGTTVGVSEQELRHTILERFDRDGSEFEIIYQDERYGYDDIQSQAASLADEFSRLGLTRGERIAIMLQNQPEFVVSILAAWRLGLIVVPVNPMYRQVELSHILQDSEARAIIVLNELVQHVEDINDVPLEFIIGVGEHHFVSDTYPQFSDLVLADSQTIFAYPDSEEAAFLCYTSGTTGPAKGALLQHRNVVMGTLLFQRFQNLSSNDVNFAIAPLFHVTGLVSGITIACAIGMTLVLDYRFQASRALRIFREHGVTFTAGPTTVFRALLKHEEFRADTFASADKIICGGAPIPKTFSDEFFEATGQKLYSGYGMTETSSPCFGTPRGAESPVQEGIGLLALGIPAPGTDCRVLDENGDDVPVGVAGEIAIRGPQVMKEYWGQPEETALSLQDGWFKTGDVAVMNEDGWFFMVDRKKNQINASGFKVWPNEVEDVLCAHPGVDEAAVVGVPDDYRGETVKAVIVLASGAHISEEDLRTFCRTHLAAYKTPTIFRFVSELPKSEAGKVVKSELLAI